MFSGIRDVFPGISLKVTGSKSKQKANFIAKISLA